MIIKIGTRKSQLALIQANLVIEKINLYYPDIKCEMVGITTTGDKILDKPLYDIGGKALFLKELEEALIDEKIDIAVHSLKDVPGILPDDLVIGGMLERAVPNDVLVSFKANSILELPKNSIVGTSSVRRKMILQNIRPDLKIVNFRGNVDSRLKKLQNGEVDATILAFSGLERSGLYNKNYCHIIPVSQMLPAVGQGVIAIEICRNNHFISEICQKINHDMTWQIIAAERSFLQYLQADCRTPLAGYAIARGKGKMQASFMLADIEGNNLFNYQADGDISDAEIIGIEAAKHLITLFS